MSRKDHKEPREPKEPPEEPTETKEEVRERRADAKPARASKEKLFSEESLEKLTASDQTDKLIQVITPKGWIAILCLFGLIFAILVWSVVGKIPVAVNGQGVVLTPRGIFSVDSARQGTVAEVFIHADDWVTPETVIARLYNETLEMNLATAKVKMDLLLSFLEDLKRNISVQKTEQAAYLELLAKYRATIDSQIKQLETLQHEERLALWNKEAMLDSIQIQLKDQLPANYVSLLQDQLFHAAETYQNFLEQQASMKILAPSTGQILEVYIEKGDWVKEGDPLALAKYPLAPGESHVCYSFFSINEGEKVYPGMEAKIGVKNIDDKVYGFLIGVVKDVSEYPSSDLALFNKIRNPQLVTFLKQGLPTVVRVVVEPVKSSKTFSGYKWTTDKGPPFYVTAGIVCDVRIDVEKRKPISYLMPHVFLKRAKAEGPNPDVFPK